MFFLGILGPPSYGIGATVRIGREMLCLPYAGFFICINLPVLLSSEKCQYTISLAWTLLTIKRLGDHQLFVCLTSGVFRLKILRREKN